MASVRPPRGTVASSMANGGVVHETRAALPRRPRPATTDANIEETTRQEHLRRRVGDFRNLNTYPVESLATPNPVRVPNAVVLSLPNMGGGPPLVAPCLWGMQYSQARMGQWVFLYNVQRFSEPQVPTVYQFLWWDVARSCWFRFNLRQGPHDLLAAVTPADVS